MSKITIRKATAKNLLELQAIGKRTFVETFSSSNRAEDMEKYLSESFSNEKLLAELSHSGSEFYLACLENEVIGYLKLNEGAAQTEKQSERAIEIERIYVLSTFHGQQVGQILLEKALELAKNQKVSYIWLGVWEKNPRAIRFYQKNGFEIFDSHIFTLGEDQQTDLLMRFFLHAK